MKVRGDEYLMQQGLATKNNIDSNNLFLSAKLEREWFLLGPGIIMLMIAFVLKTREYIFYGFASVGLFVSIHWISILSRNHVDSISIHYIENELILCEKVFLRKQAVNYRLNSVRFEKSIKVGIRGSRSTRIEIFAPDNKIYKITELNFGWSIQDVQKLIIFLESKELL